MRLIVLASCAVLLVTAVVIIGIVSPQVLIDLGPVLLAIAAIVTAVGAERRSNSAAKTLGGIEGRPAAPTRGFGTSTSGDPTGQEVLDASGE